MSSEQKFRKAKHHWIEVWVKGFFVTLGVVVISLALGDLWETFNWWRKIILVVVGLVASAWTCRSFFVHHYNKQRGVDERQGLKRRKI